MHSYKNKYININTHLGISRLPTLRKSLPIYVI